MNLVKIIDEAYELYMPQIKSEITGLAELVQSQLKQENGVPKPYNVLEIGTKFGGTFYIWNKIVQEHGAGTCISIDMSDGGIHGGVGDEAMDKRDLWFQERFNDCHFIRGNSHDNDIGVKTALLLMQKQIIDNPNIEHCNSKSVDFLFIDGDHSYEGVKQDFEMYSPFVKKGGIIAFHDIVISDRHHDRNVYVGEFWRDLTKFRLFDTQNPEKDICIIDGQHYEMIEFVDNDYDWGGIGCLIRQ